MLLKFTKITLLGISLISGVSQAADLEWTRSLSYEDCDDTCDRRGMNTVNSRRGYTPTGSPYSVCSATSEGDRLGFNLRNDPNCILAVGDNRTGGSTTKQCLCRRTNISIR